MAGRDGLQRRLQVGEGLDAVDLCGRDQRGDAGPGATAFVVPRKQSVLSGERQFPFILPMSGRFIGFIIDGMPILART